METLYHSTKKVLDQIQIRFSALETAASSEDASLINSEVESNIKTVYENCDRLEILVNKEPPSRRQNAKFQLDQLKYDARHMEASLNGILRRRAAREKEQRERSDLLQRKFTTNSARENDTAIDMDRTLDHNSSLMNANRSLDAMLDSGGAIMDSLKNQGGVLKAAHNKMLNVLNMLGLSNTVMRLTEKRAATDRVILFGGMIVTCIFIILVIVYLK